MLIRNERGETELLTMTAKQRFLQFNRNFSEYHGRIPQYHIASYLGITPAALSKHKKQWLSSTE
jgi:CRP-like cAMP-binding protein